MRVRFAIERIESVSILSFVLVFGVWSILLGSSWISNFPLLLRNCAWLGIAAIGQALLIISGEFDLSVGSVSAFVSLLFVLFERNGLGVFPSFLLAILTSTVIGLLNGAITLKLRVPSLIVTLGTLFIFRGFVYFASQGFAIGTPETLRNAVLLKILGGEPLGVNNAVLLFAAIIVVATVILGRTRFGNHVYAVGADARSAFSCGISPVRVRMICFVSCSMLAGFAGITSASYFKSVAPTTGQGMEFETIAAAVIGGCSLQGGIGSIWGTTLGVGTLLAIRAGLVMEGINIFLYQILLGLLLVVFIAIKEPLSKAISRSEPR
jgi:ribose/xylose/arabinose/galactoside ABC-type transport system permease subunit